SVHASPSPFGATHAPFTQRSPGTHASVHGLPASGSGPSEHFPAMQWAAAPHSKLPVHGAPSATAPRPRQRLPSAHSRFERHLAPSLSVPLMTPRHSGAVSDPTVDTQSQPAV